MGQADVERERDCKSSMMLRMKAVLASDTEPRSGEHMENERPGPLVDSDSFIARLQISERGSMGCLRFLYDSRRAFPDVVLLRPSK